MTYIEGVIDAVIGEIDPPQTGIEWRSAVRKRILSARQALGSRMFGFSQELYTGSQGSTPDAEASRRLAQMYPNIAAVAASTAHDHGSKVGLGCDDQFEFEFALELILDGFELLRQRNWRSEERRTGLEAV